MKVYLVFYTTRSLWGESHAKILDGVYAKESDARDQVRYLEGQGDEAWIEEEIVFGADRKEDM